MVTSSTSSSPDLCLSWRSLSVLLRTSMFVCLLVFNYPGIVSSFMWYSEPLSDTGIITSNLQTRKHVQRAEVTWSIITRELELLGAGIYSSMYLGIPGPCIMVGTSQIFTKCLVNQWLFFSRVLWISNDLQLTCRRGRDLRTPWKLKLNNLILFSPLKVCIGTYKALHSISGDSWAP